jgi:hypothetical protein
MYVPPSGLLDIISPSKLSATNKNLNNTPLRMGVVVRVHEVTDESNISKLFPEYDVVTGEQNKQLGQSFVEYMNCISMDSLGGIADFFEKKLRKSDSEDFKKTYSFDKQNGSLVLLLCIDGFSDKAIIVGSIPHASRKTKLTKEAGLHLEGEYNGLNWKIDKDGALTVTFKSKTNNEGVPQDKQAGGTHIQIDKTGQVDINTGLKDAEETYIRMDKKNKNVGLKAGSNIGLTAKKNVAINAEGNIEALSKANVAINAEGTAKFTSKSSISIEGASAVDIKGGNVTITGNNGVIIEGQQCMIDTPKVFVGQNGTAAVIQTTRFIGTGNLGVPIISQAMGPFSSAVFIAS